MTTEEQAAADKVTADKTAADTASAKVTADAVAAAKVIADAAAAKVISDKTAADAAAIEAAKKSGMTDKEAELLKDVMAKKTKLAEADAKMKDLEEKLAKYTDIDPVEAKKLLTEKSTAEKKALEDKGEFDRLKKMMAEEHAKELATAVASDASTKSALAASLAQINDLTVGQAFSNSEFVSKEMIIPPGKARTIYGTHFEIENGRIVGFDKPKSDTARTKLVDGSGESMSFEAAMKKIIETDPERNSILRTKIKEGANSGSEAERQRLKDNGTVMTGRDRMALALADKMAAKKAAA